MNTPSSFKPLKEDDFKIKKDNVKRKGSDKHNSQLVESKRLLRSIGCMRIDWVWKFSNLYCVNNKEIWGMSLDNLASEESKESTVVSKTKHPSSQDYQQCINEFQAKNVRSELGELQQLVEDLKTIYSPLQLEEKKQLIQYAKELTYHTVKETIFIPLSFREYYNGCIKNIQIKKDGKLNKYIKVPIDHKTPYEFQFKDMNEYTFKLVFSKSGFSRCEEDENNINYEYSLQELDESRIVAPSGKVIALKSLDWRKETFLENEGFPESDNGEKRGKLILRLEKAEKERRIKKEQEEKKQEEWQKSERLKRQQDEERHKGGRLKRQQDEVKEEQRREQQIITKEQGERQRGQNSRQTKHNYPNANSTYQQTQQNSYQSVTLKQLDFSQQTHPPAFPQYKGQYEEQYKGIFHKISSGFASFVSFIGGIPTEDIKKIEEPKVFELNVEIYLGKENDGFKTYEKFQLSNRKTLYVNVWKKEVDYRYDPNYFSNVFSYNNGYLINVLLDQVLDSKNSFKKWKESIMLGFDHETICFETTKNYVFAKKYFIPIIDQYFIVKIPLIIPYPSFVTQSFSNNQYFVFYDYSKGPESKHFIVIHKK